MTEKQNQFYLNYLPNSIIRMRVALTTFDARKHSNATVVRELSAVTAINSSVVLTMRLNAPLLFLFASAENYNERTV